ncbi:hypothetical protein [Streptomyces zhihengii]|uniref:Uncharacterized protein n=1 Tax=Streptomyces zhihengii TaxID=1818004 RepID=A0ABS2V3Q3_9ACTN|nr:hypothetical protein [Streptomyces zhihengii]MBM9624472.1 hypothetical protein [Streptomyces zhihengii]
MRITVTIDQPGSEFQEKLLALLAEHAVHVEMDAMWTAERAQAYYRSLPTRARRIVAGAVAGDGYVAAEDLRDDESTSLRGHSAALKRLLQRGALRGMWPEGIQPPITPQGPGFGKVGGYAMDEDLVPVFFAALTSVEDEHEEWVRRRLTQAEVLEGAIRANEAGAWDARRAVTTLSAAGHQVAARRARQILRDLEMTGLLRRSDAAGDSAVYAVTGD